MNSRAINTGLLNYFLLTILIPIVALSFACGQNEAVKTDKSQTSQEQRSGTQNQEEKQAEPTPGPDTREGENVETKADGGNPMVILKTSKGDIKVELDRENAPITVDNFLSYVNDGFYNDTIFHRVINNFMVQGGGISTELQQKPTKEPIKNEARNGLKNDRGTIAMARTGEVDSATSQFFINHVDNDFLNHGARDFGYAVFGRVVDGMDVVDEIAVVKVGPGDVPEEIIVLESVTVVEE